MSDSFYPSSPIPTEVIRRLIDEGLSVVEGKSPTRPTRKKGDA